MSVSQYRHSRRVVTEVLLGNDASMHCAPVGDHSV
jgi:hypothetical protein